MKLSTITKMSIYGVPIVRKVFQIYSIYIKYIFNIFNIFQINKLKVNKSEQF